VQVAEAEGTKKICMETLCCILDWTALGKKEDIIKFSLFTKKIAKFLSRLPVKCL
jgi:hypothetical protein